MPPKAEYWKYFNVVGVVAYCLIAECKQPNVSLGVTMVSVENTFVFWSFTYYAFGRALVL